MSALEPDFGFYGILSDPVVGYEPLAALMAARGIRLVQLRMKNCPQQTVVAVGRRLRAIVSAPSLLIINDSVEATRQVGADGVHLGQADTDYDDARRLLGPRAIIGLSTHNRRQVREACNKPDPPDYIGVGPVFATQTKQNPDPVLGLLEMRAMIAEAGVPAVAIGGIRPSNVADVLAYGAKNFTAVGCVNRAHNPAGVLDRLLSAAAAGKQR
jgi:thiamine-phosphate pyrophosphorylase